MVDTVYIDGFAAVSDVTEDDLTDAARLTDKLLCVIYAALSGPPNEQKVRGALTALAYVSSAIICGAGDLDTLEFFKDVMRGLINKDDLSRGNLN